MFNFYKYLLVFIPQHLTFGSPVFPALHVQDALPLLFVQVAPTPHGFGVLSHGSYNLIYLIYTKINLF